MSQVGQAPDPEFVAKLSHYIGGMYFSEVSEYDGDKIRDEFGKCVRDRKLLRDEEFMHNLMFLVRKREVCELLREVERIANDTSLKPRAAVSALKTWYACGSSDDRERIDEQLVRRLQADKRLVEQLEIPPTLESADRIGGKRTLELLKQWLKETAQKQKQAEKETPDEHVRIGRLDQLRSMLDRHTYYMALRIEIEGKDSTGRAAAMAELYLRRTGALQYWGYKELVAHPAPEAAQGVRSYLARTLGSLSRPQDISDADRLKTRQDNRLRGLCLLQAMGQPLSPEEQAFFDEHAKRVEEDAGYFRPNYDWEDVLDQH